LKYLGVDLAAKFSAGVVTENGKVLFEFDSWRRSQIEFADYCVSIALEYDVELIMVEDLPYGISQQAQTKPPTRLQGILIKSAYDAGVLDKMWFVNPIEWQRTFKIKKPTNVGAREVAQLFGFEQRHPIEMYADSIPPLGKEHSKERAKVRGQLKKASTDYDDAFLICLWTAMEHKKGTLTNYKGVQQYEG
jgi:hypothetical protein